MRRGSLVPLTVGLAAALALSACGSSSKSPSASASKTYAKDAAVSFALSADPGTLDPSKTLIGPAQQINRFTYDTLGTQDPSGKLAPTVAESWQVSPASIVFKIRTGVTCSDGTPFTAQNVKDTFDFLKTSKSPLIGTALPDANFTDSVDTTANTFTLTVPAPNGFLLLDALGVPLICPKGLAAPADLARHSEGTGPYVLTEDVPGDHYTVERRDRYTWGPDGGSTATAGLPKSLTFRVVSNESTAANLLITGQLDFAQLHGADRARLKGKPGYTTVNVSTDSIMLTFNERAGLPGADEAVRVALTEATSRDQVTKVATAGYGKPMTSMVAFTPRVCPDDAAATSLPGFDIAKAKAALDAAGWVPGADGIRAKNGESLRLRLVTALPPPSGQDTGELLAQEWKDLGVDAKIKTITATQLTTTLFQTQAYDAVVWPLEIQIPATVYGLFSGPAAPAGGNFGAVNNVDYTRLGGEALKTPGTAGCDLWTQAEAALFQHADAVPLGALTAAYIGRNAQFAYILGFVEPTTVRILAH